MAEKPEKDRIEETKKEPYQKPTLGKHGDLKDLTAGGTPGAPLGCTKLFV